MDTNLKEAGVCRIFISSPFRGMEGEREEFTRRYWPQIDSYCKSKGVQFVPVDMRWGITTELSDNNQTINICLREIDRSDMFVGLYAQRYGWHGKDNEALQKNFDVAVPTYPWIDGFRDKSITELEFLHGHLNHPGKIPSVIGFRSKAYDNAQSTQRKSASTKPELRRKDTEEGEHAVKLLDALKARVKASEKQCLALKMTYATPEEGAKFVFDVIWEYLTKHLLKDTDKRSELEHQLCEHESFCKTLATSYVPNEKLMNKVTDHVTRVSSDSGSPVLVVTGEGGSGKTSLLGNWINRQDKVKSKQVLVYHFIGSSAESALVKNILLRIVCSLDFGLHSNSIKEKSDFWSKLELQYGNLDDAKLAQKWVQLMQEYAAAKRKVVILLAGLDKINYGGHEKIVQPLFWVPSNFPNGCSLVISTNMADRKHLNVLQEKTKFVELSMEPLSLVQQQKMCKEALGLRGKTLSTSQMDAVVMATGTANPLFLDIVLEELCMFGNFRELDHKIKSLVSCKSSVELFEKYLERLEIDYNSKEYKHTSNLVEQVVCALRVSRLGLQETELIEMLEIPQNLWPPLYYGLEKYTISRQGFLRIAHVELDQAIYNRYIKNEKTKKAHIEKQVQYYMDVIKKSVGKKLPKHLLKEVLWAAHASGNSKVLQQVITTPTYFKTFVEGKQEAYLFEYVQWLGHDQHSLLQLFHGTFKQQAEKDKGNAMLTMLENLWCFQEFLVFADFLQAQKKNLLYIKTILASPPAQKLNAEEHFHNNIKVYMRLGQTYCENMECEKSLEANQSFLDLIQGKYKENEFPAEVMSMLAAVYHSMGVVSVQCGQLTQAEQYLMTSQDIHKKLFAVNATEIINIKQSMKVLAEIKFKRGSFKESAEMYEYLIKEEEKLEAGLLSIEMSNSYTSLSLCYRKLWSFDQAKRCLDKAMEISKAVLGDNHRDVAIVYFNMANLAKDRDDLKGMVEHLNKALEIHKFLGDKASTSHNMLICYDNLIMALIYQKNWREAYDTYWAIFDAIEDKFESMFGFNHDSICRYAVEHEKYQDALKILKLLLASKFVEPEHFLLLQKLKQTGAISPKEITASMSLESALKRFPESEELLLAEIELDCIPARKLGELDVQLQNCLKNAADKERLVCQCANKCVEAGWQDGAIAILESWRTKIQHPEFIERDLAMLHYEKEQFSKATECFRRAIKLNPKQWQYQDKLVILLLMQGRLKDAKLELQKLGDDFSSEPEAAEKARTYTAQIAQMEKQFKK